MCIRDSRRVTPTYTYELQFFRRGLQITTDGSILQDGAEAYLLNARLKDSTLWFDFFHWSRGREGPLFARYQRVISTSHSGFTVRRIILLQGRWRKQWKRRHHEDIVRLAREFLKLYADARQRGIILPSLDYERKVAARKYDRRTKQKRQRARERCAKADTIDKQMHKLQGFCSCK